jgi:hypothetical protein
MATHVHTRSSTRNRHHLPRLLFFKGGFLDILLLRCCCCIIIYIYRRIACLSPCGWLTLFYSHSLSTSLSISSLGSWESPLHTCRLATAVTHSAAEEEPPSLAPTQEEEEDKKKNRSTRNYPPWRHFPSSSQSRNSDNERLYREYTSYIFLYSHSRDERKK